MKLSNFPLGALSRLVWIAALLVALVGNASAAQVGAREQCFRQVPNITACFDDPFVDYWQANGGLPVFGYPITGPNVERNRDLQLDLVTQWTERNRLEIHPENAAPYQVLLGRMGAELLQQIGRDPRAEGRETGPRNDCLWFETTGHNVCDQAPGVGFKSYWQSHGLAIPQLDNYNRSLQLFGLPLTAPRMETNAAGDTVLTQWFERARFEWHPNKPDQFKVLLGLLGNELRAAGVPQSSSIFGAEISHGRAPAVAAPLREINPHWVRYNRILWSDVEPTRGARNWGALQNIEAELAAINASGGIPILIVRGTPVWARKVADKRCGPIRDDALDAFAAFMGDLVARYGAAPHNVLYWEIWNEPDVDPTLIEGDMPFGCWGNGADAYYGGGSYAELLKRVYPAVKRVNPRAQVVHGGLLLDCDPTRPPAGKDCKPARFLEGVLRNGGGNAFDILAFHGYPLYSHEIKDWDLTYGPWQHRGGVVLGKMDFLRTIMRQYGVVKPLLLNEGGMICYQINAGCPSEQMRSAQANYAVRLYTRSWANGLLGAIWFTFDGPGWREGGLLDGAQAPRPAYTAVKFLSGILNGATYMGQLSKGDVEGYLFRKGTTTYQIYWTNSSTNTNVPAPAGLRNVYNIAGQTIPTSGSNVGVGFEPVIMEARP